VAKKNTFLSALKMEPTEPDEAGHFRHHFSLTMELQEHPLFMAMAAIAVAIILYYLYKTVTGSSGTASTSQLTGQPFLSGTGLDGGQQQPVNLNFTATGTLPTGGTNNGTGGTGGTGGLQGQPQLGGFWGIIRPSSNSGWDTKYAGIPVRSAVGNTSSFQGLLPYGSQVQIIGPAINGSSNRAVGSPQSSEWYPIAGGGFISAGDLRS
jgi:hypothetical protein